MKFRRLSSDSKGFILPAVLSFIIVVLIIAGAVLEIINTNLSNINNNVKSQRAFNIAEAGINYYLWHLSHNGIDYQDGTGAPLTQDPKLGYGPYVHNYVDGNAVNVGTFTLWIKPQGAGSTIVTVESIGKVKGDSNIRTVVAKIGAASFASYGVISDQALWFGNTETASGPVHSNQGIRLDGANTDTVTSANSTYTPPSGLGGGTNDPGVWCSPSVTTPVNCNTRNKTTWQYPVAAVTFPSVTTSLCNMKKVAFGDNASTSALAGQANICTIAAGLPVTRTSAYLPQRCTTGSGTSCSYSLTRGYLIKLNNNGTYDLLNVNGEDDTKKPYTAALTTSPIATGIAIPPSGVIFAEDNVWVLSNTTFHGRVTIASARLAQANVNTEAVIAGPLLYSTKNGSDAIGLVSEGSVFIAPYAPFAPPSNATYPGNQAFNFEVDGALLAENNNVTYGEYSETTNQNLEPDYRSNTNRCAYGWKNSNQTFTFYGSVASRQLWTWTYNWFNCGDGVFDATQGGYIVGIENNDSQYDYNLLYAPPPSYPLANGYQILSWREVLTHP